MAEGYSWNYVRSDTGNRLPGPEHLGWWAAVALLISVILHVVVFFALERLELALNFRQAEELRTAAVNVRQVEVRPMDEPARMEPEDVVQPPEDTASLLEEIDLLAALPENQEIEMRPDLTETELALQIKSSADSGKPQTDIKMQDPQELSLDAEMPEIGFSPVQIKPAAVGQMTIDPGAPLEDKALDQFTEDLLESGNNGKVEASALDGVESLDTLLGLPPNVLLSKKTLLPSDLLFEFNESELRESAKVGLMKLALLMDRNPKLFCWIEGHTDLIGGDAFNLELSLRRAEAVKTYLVNSLRMDADRIYTRGFGRRQPLVKAGDAESQAPNRRVEIRMRKTPPPSSAAAASGELSPPPHAEPVLVKPKRALRVDLQESPRASVIEEVPRAKPVIPDGVPRAVPRANVVGE